MPRSREEIQRDLTPLARWLHRRGITPNQVTVIAFLMALVTAGLFALSTPANPWWLVPGGLILISSLVLDGADGVLARVTDQASPLGDYLDHVLDRYADVAVILGLVVTPWAPIWLGLAAILGTLLTSYMGTQAHAVGIGRSYGGLVGRADRVVILSLVPIAHAALVWYDVSLPYDTNLIWLALAWIAIGGNVTALQRFYWGVRDLREPPAQ